MILLEWDSVGSGAIVSNTKAKTGTYSFRGSSNRSTAFLSKTIATTSQVRCGFHVNHAGWAAGVPGLISFYSGSTIIAVVTVDATTITLKIGAATVASVGTGSFGATDTWKHIGVDLKIDAAGWFNLYIDGVLFVGFTGDTNDAGTTIDSVQALSGVTSSGAQWNSYIYIDDFFCDDTTGESATAVVPDRRFTYQAASGNGASSQLTGSDGNSTDNYLLVDDLPHDGDTTYVLASSSGLRDLYDTATFTLGSGFAIAAVIPVAIARKTDAGIATTLKLLAKNGGSESLSAAQTLATSYGMVWARNTTQPNASAWDAAGVNAAEYGVESSGAYA